MIKKFDEYITDKIVRKITPDINRAENLKIEAKRKYILLEQLTNNMGINDQIANDYVEYCYNIIMFLIRAKMLNQGYNSLGNHAHEAEISYLRTIGFNEIEINILDQLRYFRNGILYYGKRFDKEYAQKIISFTKKAYKNLNK